MQCSIVDPFGLGPGAPAIPFPIPWIPPYPIVSPIVRGVGGLIGLILGELAFPDATGIDDARAIPKTKNPPCDKDKDKDCELQYENDSSVCRWFRQLDLAPFDLFIWPHLWRINSQTPVGAKPCGTRRVTRLGGSADRGPGEFLKHRGRYKKLRASIA